MFFTRGSHHSILTILFDRNESRFLLKVSKLSLNELVKRLLWMNDKLVLESLCIVLKVYINHKIVTSTLCAWGYWGVGLLQKCNSEKRERWSTPIKCIYSSEIRT